MIRRQRIKLKITQKQLAELVGVSQAYISKLESDRFVNITIIEIIKLSKALRLKQLDIAKYFLDKYIDYNVEFEEDMS